MIKNETDVEAILAQNSTVKQSKFNNGKFNKTTMFVLPMVEMNYKMRWLSKYLKNAFLDDGGIEHDFIRPVFLLMKVKNYKEKDWQDFCKSVLTLDILRQSYITDYYIGQEDGHNLVMYVFNVSAKWAEDYDLFLQGMYSKMSDRYKSIFSREVYLTTGEKRESQVWGALHKSDTLKDTVVKEFINPSTSTAEDVISLRRDMNTWEEIWDKPQLREETFRFKEKEDANTNNITETQILSRSWNDS